MTTTTIYYDAQNWGVFLKTGAVDGSLMIGTTICKQRVPLECWMAQTKPVGFGRYIDGAIVYSTINKSPRRSQWLKKQELKKPEAPNDRLLAQVVAIADKHRF